MIGLSEFLCMALPSYGLVISNMQDASIPVDSTTHGTCILHYYLWGKIGPANIWGRTKLYQLAKKYHRWLSSTSHKSLLEPKSRQDKTRPGSTRLDFEMVRSFLRFRIQIDCSGLQERCRKHSSTTSRNVTRVAPPLGDFWAFTAHFGFRCHEVGPPISNHFPPRKP
jgi:hypothetical protein